MSWLGPVIVAIWFVGMLILIVAGTTYTMTGEFRLPIYPRRTHSFRRRRWLR